MFNWLKKLFSSKKPRGFVVRKYKQYKLPQYILDILGDRTLKVSTIINLIRKKHPEAMQADQTIHDRICIMTRKGELIRVKPSTYRKA